MAYKDLREFIAALEQRGQLRRIQTEVDPELEITEITDRVSKMEGDKNVALLFENVKGSKMPVLMNAFGSYDRMALALGVEKLDDVADELREMMKLPYISLQNKMNIVTMIPMLKKAINFPKYVKNAPCQEVIETENPNLDEIPILKCWPQDGGPFVTLPLIFTKNPQPDGTYIGVFGYCSYYYESDADHPATSISIIDVPVNIQEYSFDSEHLGDITIYQEWDDVMLPYFPELKDVRCKVETSPGGYSHWRAIRYDSRSNEKTEIMHIVAHAGDNVNYIIDTGKAPLLVKTHKYKDPKKKHNDEEQHTDKDEIYYRIEFANEPYRSNALPTGPDTYNVEGKAFSIPIGDEDAYDLAFEQLSVADYLTVEWLPTLTDGQMGFMYPIWTSGVSILGLKENIGQAKIIDVKN